MHTVYIIYLYISVYHVIVTIHSNFQLLTHTQWFLAQVQNILNSALFNGAAVEVTAFDADFCLKSWTKTDATVGKRVPKMCTKMYKDCGGLTCSMVNPKMTFYRGNHVKISIGFHQQLGRESQKNRDRRVSDTSDVDKKHIHYNFRTFSPYFMFGGSIS